MKSQIWNISESMPRTEIADHFLESLQHKTYKNIGLVSLGQKISG